MIRIDIIFKCNNEKQKYLAPYFIEEDIDYLLKYINSSSIFALKKEQILIGTRGQYTPAIGAALFYVDRFIQHV